MKKNRLFLMAALIILLAFSSCSNGNPMNAFIQRFTSFFAASEKKTVPATTNAEITLLAQKDDQKQNEKAAPADTVSKLDSLLSDSTVGLPFTTEVYAYKSKQLRDPFISVLELQRDQKSEIDIESAMYYGLLRGKSGKMALLKDASGMGYVFFEGQKIKNGVLLKVEQDSLIFKLDEYGVVRNKVIRLIKSADKKKKK